MVFKCERPLGEIYFEGKINGQDFCTSYPKNGTRLSNAIGTMATTSTENPVLEAGATRSSSFFSFIIIPPAIDELNGALEDFEPFVFIETPHIKDSIIYPAHKYIDDFIKEGDLTMRSEDVDKYSGFDFRIHWGCVMLPGYDYYYKKDPYQIPAVGEILTPSVGDQSDLTFRVSEFQRAERGDSIYYDITFEIACDLYYGSSSKAISYFGRLEDGVYRTMVAVKK